MACGFSRSCSDFAGSTLSAGQLHNSEPVDLKRQWSCVHIISSAGAVQNMYVSESATHCMVAALHVGVVPNSSDIGASRARCFAAMNWLKDERSETRAAASGAESPE